MLVIHGLPVWCFTVALHGIVSLTASSYGTIDYSEVRPRMGTAVSTEVLRSAEAGFFFWVKSAIYSYHKLPVQENHYNHPVV